MQPLINCISASLLINIHFTKKEGLIALVLSAVTHHASIIQLSESFVQNDQSLSEMLQLL